MLSSRSYVWISLHGALPPTLDAHGPSPAEALCLKIIIQAKRRKRRSFSFVGTMLCPVTFWKRALLELLQLYGAGAV